MVYVFTRTVRNFFAVPDSKGYAEVKPETCFTTVADAEKAGFRAPHAISEHPTQTPWPSNTFLTGSSLGRASVRLKDRLIALV
jgi:hypothetical protein